MICLVRVVFFARGAGGRLVSRLDVACPDFLRLMPCCQGVITFGLHGLELPKELSLVPWRPIASYLLAMEYGCLEQVLKINIRRKNSPSSAQSKRTVSRDCQPNASMYHDSPLLPRE
ncbi:hypothetical protein V8C40DRAFT_230684, partial [Trichoderma camerunense]